MPYFFEDVPDTNASTGNKGDNVFGIELQIHNFAFVLSKHQVVLVNAIQQIWRKSVKEGFNEVAKD